MSINFKLEANNIGPHKNLKIQRSINSINIGLYANNGSGKTFISRMIRLAQKNIDADKDKLLTFGENNGSFHMEFSDDSNKNTLDIFIDEQGVKVANNTGFIFHVFNSDYIEENLEAHKYAPDGNIEGYILGKLNIDLTKEKNKEEELFIEIQTLKKKIEGNISESKSKLVNLGISRNTKEFREINYENLYNDLDINEEYNYSDLIKLHAKMKTMPDLPDINLLKFSYDNMSKFLQSAIDIMGTRYTKSSINDEFKKQLKEKQLFVEEGINIITKSGTDRCPFCNQTFDEEALAIIEIYNDFLSESEAKILKEIDRVELTLDKIKELIVEFQLEYQKTKQNFDNLKQYIPSYASIVFLSLQDCINIPGDFNSLFDLLNNKKNNIEQSFDIREHIKNIENYLGKLINIAEECNKQITDLNNKKNNLRKENLELNRKLCKSQFLQLKQSNKEDLNSIKSLEEEYKKIIDEIKKKENQVKKSKRERVAEDLKYFLNLFFDNKYTFDEDNFCVRFLNRSLADNTHYVLSEGEKSILSFCHYLASTHMYVTNESDYKRLFFVIDDPISSLDFHHVYTVSQIIRNLKHYYFGGSKRTRFIIFTHNLEFMSILMRNRIIGNRFYLSNNIIKALPDELVMPYHSHLRDIFQVAEGAIRPSHTTPNSIRHVLETIWRFEAPNKEFVDYFNDMPDLQNSSFLYSLFHDLSHGNIRLQNCYTPEMVMSGCKDVIAFIEKRYTGQIEQIKKAV